MNKYIIAASLFAIVGCQTRQAPTLPKVKTEKAAQLASDDTAQKMQEARKAINALNASVVCTNAAEWRTAPIGAKPCGGPAQYIAYPIKCEEEVLPKIREYTRLNVEYNREKGLLSDCSVIPEPAGVRCENGKAVLVKGTASAVY